SWRAAAWTRSHVWSPLAWPDVEADEEPAGAAAAACAAGNGAAGDSASLPAGAAGCAAGPQPRLAASRTRATAASPRVRSKRSLLMSVLLLLARPLATRST